MRIWGGRNVLIVSDDISVILKRERLEGGGHRGWQWLTD